MSSHLRDRYFGKEDPGVYDPGQTRIQQNGNTLIFSFFHEGEDAGERRILIEKFIEYCRRYRKHAGYVDNRQLTRHLEYIIFNKMIPLERGVKMEDLK